MTFQEVKKEFFSFRNGIVAKAFLDAGYPYKHIYGLQLPQIAEISNRCAPPAHELAFELWEDRECRESRILSFRLFDRDRLTMEELRRLIRDVRTREEADLLAFYLLKRRKDAREIADNADLFGEEGAYVREALNRNLN